mgnify:CR=1 FL=1
MRVLITGAGGFIGANLTRRMISLGHNVHILLHPQSNPWRLNDILKHTRPEAPPCEGLGEAYYDETFGITDF